MILAFQIMLRWVTCVAPPKCATHLHPTGTFILHSYRYLYGTFSYLHSDHISVNLRAKLKRAEGYFAVVYCHRLFSNCEIKYE